MIVAFDADDTLWHNESHFEETHRAFEELLAPWAPSAEVDDRLFAVDGALTVDSPRGGPTRLTADLPCG